MIAEHKYPNGSPRLWLDVSLAMVSGHVVRHLNDLFPGYMGSRIIKSGRTLWTWRVTSRKAHAFLEQVLPYLKVKRAEAEMGMTFQHLVDSTPLTGRPISANALTIRRAMKQELSDLKKGN